jgi:FrmR/RcnR family transcriptional regulator, repressor of frmRAB operon
MNPPKVTVARRLRSSGGVLLGRGFIRSLWLRDAARTSFDTRRKSLYTPLQDGIKGKMAHTLRNQQKLLNRVRRIRGQLEAVERALEEKAGCAAVLQQATACRGALDGLIAEVVEGHIREHVMDPTARAGDARSKAAEELVEIVHSFLT